MSNRFLKDRFRSIIDKYLKGRSTAEQEELVDYFYDSIPEEDISESELSIIEKDLRNRIDRNIKPESRSLRSKNQFVYLKIATCAAVLIISSLYFYSNYYLEPNTGQFELTDNMSIEANSVPVFVFEDGESYTLQDSVFEKLPYKIIDGEKTFVIADYIDISDDRERKLSQIKNPTDKVFAFLLQDGTTAWLNPNSTLDILPDMGDKRIVKIEGTVLFNVRKVKGENGYKPFVVKTALQTIEVLGTKFIVNSIDGLEDILLLEGKVKLTHNKYLTEVILKPNQKASLKEIESKILVTKSTDNYKIEAWHKGLFHFENEKISVVIAEISQWYGKDFSIDKTVQDVPITGMISRYKNINEVLDIIKMTNNIDYEVRDGKIYIK